MRLLLIFAATTQALDGFTYWTNPEQVRAHNANHKFAQPASSHHPNHGTRKTKLRLRNEYSTR